MTTCPCSDVPIVTSWYASGNSSARRAGFDTTANTSSNGASILRCALASTVAMRHTVVPGAAARSDVIGVPGGERNSHDRARDGGRTRRRLRVLRPAERLAGGAAARLPVRRAVLRRGGADPGRPRRLRRRALPAGVRADALPVRGDDAIRPAGGDGRGRARVARRAGPGAAGTRRLRLGRTRRLRGR